MKKAAVVLAVFGAVLFGCKNETKKEVSTDTNLETVEETPVDMHNSENSIDLTGVYVGVLPCADCSGINTVLDLKEDKTFTLTETYLGKPDGENEFSKEGKYAWNKDGSLIRLKSESGRYQFKVGEDQLTMMDLKGNIIEGDLAEKYILKKTFQ